ncbi:transmembrane protein 183-like [Dendronephthya gigantea]|uniref:transmembrane protein 183-like n=1 Tax=Dendronephthya gigantea TaxID=151771 RepID=UPI00106B4A7C|nr:transmembrane protein 183-like [Dendronephthya gigantea]
MDENNAIIGKRLLPCPSKGSVDKHEDSEISHEEVMERSKIYYPLDVWCILAKYIEPLQIQTFACICRSSYLAINSSTFWNHLYKRYIKDTVRLPKCLMQNFGAKNIGLKIFVIRALFLLHPNLSSRFMKEDSLDIDKLLLQQVIGLRCCNTWYKIESSLGSSHVYLFRFQLKSDGKKVSAPNLPAINQDYLTRNNEENYVVLQVRVREFTRVHFKANTALLEVSLDTDNASLTMEFGCSDVDWDMENNRESVVLNAVSAIKLLRWWHPSYPHRN